MTLVMNQLLDFKLTKDSDEEEKGNKTIEKQENDTMFLWDCVSLFDTEEESDLKHENVLETTVTTRSQDLVNKENSILPKIKKLQENVKKPQKNNIDDKILEPTISSQDSKQVNMPAKPIEDKAGNVKENLKAYEVLEEELPTNNQPVEETVEASVGGKTRFKTPPFLLTLEILNHNVHNCLVDSGSSINVMPLAVCKKINGQPKPTTWEVTQLDRTNVKVVEEMEDVLIRLSTNKKICQYIDIMVADIPNGYGLILNHKPAQIFGIFWVIT